MIDCYCCSDSRHDCLMCLKFDCQTAAAQTNKKNCCLWLRWWANRMIGSMAAAAVATTVNARKTRRRVRRTTLTLTRRTSIRRPRTHYCYYCCCLLRRRRRPLHWRWWSCRRCGRASALRWWAPVLRRMSTRTRVCAWMTCLWRRWSPMGFATRWAIGAVRAPRLSQTDSVYGSKPISEWSTAHPFQRKITYLLIFFNRV